MDKATLKIISSRILRTMGETGQPPDRGALLVNVGTEEYLDVLREEYLLPIREARANSTFKLVQAPFGGGKTHFLMCFRETAWREGFLTSLVSVSPKECPFDDLVSIYRKVVSELEAPPEREEEEADHGIGDVLRAEVEKRRTQAGEEALREWIREEVSRLRVENHAFRKAACLFMEAVLDGDGEREALLESFLRGEDVGPSEVRSLGVRAILEENNAFSFLKSLVQLFHGLGAPGLVLLFDEVDRVMSLTVRRRRTIADNLREMIDACGRSDLPGLVFLYAVPPEFMTTLVPEYPALEQRLRGSRLFSSGSPMSPLIDLDRLPLGPEELFRKIGYRLLSLFQAAHDDPLDEKIQKKNIQALAEEMALSQLESGARRAYVKTLIQMLTEQHREGQRVLEPEEIARLSGTGGSAPPSLDDEEIF